MPGRLNYETVQTADPRLAKAFCEGRAAQIAAYPETASNPHPSGSEHYTAFAAGVASYDGANPTSYIAADCCADRGTSA